MFQVNQNQSSVYRRGLAFCLMTMAMLVGVAANTAQAASSSPAIVSIDGVTQGEVVTGDLQLSVTVKNNPSKVMLTLIAPNRNRKRVWRHEAPYSFVRSADGSIGTWNALKHPEGEYLLRVRVYNDRHKASDRASVRFTVRHTPPAPPPAPAQMVSFDEGLADTHTFGEQTVLTFTSDGVLAENDNVLVLAWSSAEGRMIDVFAHTVHSEPFQVDPAMLDLLPAGSNKIQLLLRRDGAVIYKAERVLEVISLVTSEPDPIPTESGPAPTEPTPTKDTPTVPIPVDETPVAEAPTPDPTSDTPVTNEKDVPITDETGWTQFTASPDTRIIYVSSSQGDNANDGLSPKSPLRTQAAAVKLLRNGYPDWMLLKRGDTFRGGLRGDGYWTKSGRSATEPMMIGAYGDINQPRPKFATDGKSFIDIHHGTTIKHIAFVDLHLYANQRDPGSSDFVDGRSKENGIRWLSPMDNVLFEGCLIEYYSFGMVFQALDGKVQRGLTLRRNVVRYSYTPWDVGHSSGLFIKKNYDVTIEQNVLDHNGWNRAVSGGSRTKFNHNAYITHCKNVKIYDNLVTRGSAFGFKIRSDSTGGFDGCEIKGNVLAENINTITFNGNKVDGVYQPYAIKNAVISRNVFTQMGGALDGSDQSFGIELRSVENVTVEDNIWVDKQWHGKSFAVYVEWLPQKNILIQRNVAYTWEAKHIMEDPKSQATIQYNLIDEDASRFVDASRTIHTYAQSVGQSDLGNLLGQAIQQRKGRWYEDYTAKKMVTYFRNGFELTPFD